MPTQDSNIERTTEYLAGILKLDPVIECDRLFSARARFLQLDSADSQPVTDLADQWNQREGLAQKISEIRIRFWREDVGCPEETLASLDCSQFPDLKHAAERLCTVAGSRQEFMQLVQDEHRDVDFAASLRKVLVAGPREAAAERDEAIDSIHDAQQLKKIKGMLRDLCESLPQVYGLETDWLDAVLRMRKRRRKNGSPVSNGGPMDFETDYIVTLVTTAVLYVLTAAAIMSVLTALSK